MEARSGISTRIFKILAGGCLGSIALCILGQGIMQGFSSGNIEIPVCNAPANAPVILPASAMQQDKGEIPKGELAFITSRGLMVIDLENASRANLSFDLPEIAKAKWSHDRSRVVVMIKRGELWVIDPGAKTMQPVFRPAGEVSEIVWSPDSTRVAVTSGTDQPGDPGQVDVFDIPGSGVPRPIASMSLPEHGSLGWSPDGTSLLIPQPLNGRDVPGYQLWTAEPLSEDREPSEYLTFPLWSPDGKRIAFECSANFAQAICLTDPQTPQVEKQYKNRTGIFSLGSWSPDGRWLSGSTYHDSQQWLTLLNPDTGVFTEKGCMSSLYGPSWSPDSRHILFYYDDHPAIIELAASSTVVVSDGFSWMDDYAWSVDGSWLASAVSKPHSIELYVVRLDGSGSRHFEIETEDNFVLPFSLMWLPE